MKRGGLRKRAAPSLLIMKWTSAPSAGASDHAAVRLAYQSGELAQRAEPAVLMDRRRDFVPEVCVRDGQFDPLVDGPEFELDARNAFPSSSTPPCTQRQLITRRRGGITSRYSPCASCSSPSGVGKRIRNAPPTRASTSTQLAGNSSGGHRRGSRWRSSTLRRRSMVALRSGAPA